MVEDLLFFRRVKLVSRRDYFLLRIGTKDVLDAFWVTITLGPIRLIAYPYRFKSEEEALNRVYTLVHELEHVDQADVPFLGSVWLGNLTFYFEYALMYLPVFGAWFRYDYEVKAYVKGYRAQIEGEGWTPDKEKMDQWVEWVAVGLWKYYFFTIPKFITRNRLKRELDDLYEVAV